MKLMEAFISNVFVKIYLISQIVTRFILSIYALFYKQINPSELPGIFVSGIANDLVSLSYALPCMLLISIIFDIILKNCARLLLFVRIFGCFALWLAMLSNLLSELVFWDEFGTRYNFIAVDYLIYTTEIIGTLKESLPYKEIISIIFVTSLVICAFSFRRLLNNSTSNLTKLYLAIISALLSYSSFCFYSPEKISLSNNVYAQEIARNGPYEFVSAFYNNGLDYFKFYPNIDSKEALDSVRSLIKQDNQEFVNDSSIERITTTNARPSKYNIVLIVVESLSAEYLTDFGSPDNITPYLDSIKKDSLFFTNLYATGTRTVRGLEALTLGTPPLPGSSIIRRPANSNLFNISTVFKHHGYDSNFMFGGFSYFDNLENYFSNNGYKVTDRNNLSKDEITFANIWGVADEDLFKKSLEINDESYNKHTPFFSLIMTTSNHRPYTFPENRIDLPSGGGRRAAVKYTDYAIGKFIEDAKKRGWFDNTIFIITADHCASSAGKTKLPIEKYHIPLLIYAPKILKPNVIDSLASQIDILPTIFGLLNFSYNSKFMGRDILKSPAGRAFISTYQSLGYMKNDHLVILHPKSTPQLYKLNGSDKEQITKDDNNEYLIKEAIGFYQTSYELFYNGKMKE